MKKKPICGICRKFVKVEPLNNEINEVVFICKTHGNITTYVEWQ